MYRSILADLCFHGQDVYREQNELAVIQASSALAPPSQWKKKSTICSAAASKQSGLRNGGELSFCLSSSLPPSFFSEHALFSACRGRARTERPDFCLCYELVSSHSMFYCLCQWVLGCHLGACKTECHIFGSTYAWETDILSGRSSRPLSCLGPCLVIVLGLYFFRGVHHN